MELGQLLHYEPAANSFTVVYRYTEAVVENGRILLVAQTDERPTHVE